ncbi:MAG: hypothetical protein ACFFDK_16500 [Promethearchaeota archaeon]
MGKTGIESAANTKSGKPNATEIRFFLSLIFFFLRYYLPVKKLYAIFNTEVKLTTSSAYILIFQ